MPQKCPDQFGPSLSKTTIVDRNTVLIMVPLQRQIRMAALLALAAAALASRHTSESRENRQASGKSTASRFLTLHLRDTSAHSASGSSPTPRLRRSLHRRLMQWRSPRLAPLPQVQRCPWRSSFIRYWRATLPSSLGDPLSIESFIFFIFSCNPLRALRLTWPLAKPLNPPRRASERERFR